MTTQDLRTSPLPNADPTSVALSDTPSAAHPAARITRLAAGSYFLLAAVGGVGTWYYNLAYAASGDGGNYLGDWFANAASSSAAVDIIVVLVVVSVFYLREGRRLGWRLPLVLLFIPLSAAVAVAFAFPLFLGLRELALGRARRHR